MKRLFTVIFAGLLSMPLSANTGRVDDINYNKRTIVIDDVFYKLSPQLEVIDKDGKKTTLFAVKKDRYVSINSDSSTKVITSLNIMAAIPLDDTDDEPDRDD